MTDHPPSIDHDQGSTLRLVQLKKQIGADFWLDADISVAPQERCAIVGPSGSGKTSLLKTILGILPFTKGDTGKIILGSDDITHWPVQQRQIGMVFQDQALFPSMDVAENLSFGLRIRRVPRDERMAEAEKWLEKVGMRSKMYSSIQNLSGGERQRLALLRAIVWKPKLLLFDEPLSALDAPLRKLIRQEILDLHMLWPVPLLFVTHDEADISALATREILCTLENDGSRRRFYQA